MWMVSVQLQYMLVFCKCVKVHYNQMIVHRRTQVYVYMIVFIVYAVQVFAFAHTSVCAQVGLRGHVPSSSLQPYFRVVQVQPKWRRRSRERVR